MPDRIDVAADAVFEAAATIGKAACDALAIAVSISTAAAAFYLYLDGRFVVGTALALWIPVGVIAWSAAPWHPPRTAAARTGPSRRADGP